MEKELNNYLKSIAIGIRFRPNFSIEDRLGSITDKLLYSKGSYFNPDFFPIAQGNVGLKKLVNDRTNNSLHIDNSNIILELHFNSYNKNYLEEINKQFEECIIKGILIDFGVNDIIRLGYINRYIIEETKFSKMFIDKTIGETMEDIQDLNLRFTKKYGLFESYLKKDTNDYNLVIYNFIKPKEENNLLISLDFQRYYDPALGRAISIKFDSFLKEMKKFNSKKFPEWIDKNFGELSAVA